MRLWLIFVLLSNAAMAQFTYVLNQQIPVTVDGNTLDNPWAGGLNAAQVSTIDLNGDGIEDLAIYDRMASKIYTFLAMEGKWAYAPEFETLFPDAVAGFMLLRDFNCDGRKDLFTKDVQGILVFKNVTQPGGTLSWQQEFFYTGFPGPKSQVMLTKGFSGKINLQLQADDLPALVDADGDGDLDVLNVKFVGTRTIEYHKNFSMERYGTCDSLDLERITQTWGGVEECECGLFSFGGEPCAPGGRIRHAGGKSLLAIDADGDSDLDILFSEGSCAGVFLLPNTGDTENPVIESSTSYPPISPVSIIAFPSVYSEDVDFDGLKDLLASPNIFFREYLQTNLKRSVWYYKNTGTQQVPVFSFQKTNFLQDQMIDVGENAVPVFFDVNADGDLDLIIGGYIDGVHYYENTGTRSEPAFNFVTDNLFGLTLYNFTNIKPQFADMNGDAKADLIFTASNQFGFGTALYYIPNTSSVGIDFSNQQPVSLNFFITSTENVLVTDTNGDRLPDLLVGKANGSLEYWRNTGTPSTPSFTLEDQAYLGFGASVLRQNLSGGVGDLDGDGKLDLVLGDQSGKLSIIRNFKEEGNAANAITNILYDPITSTYISKNLGGRIWPTVANLFNTNRPSIVVGNITGGLQVLQNDESAPLPDAPQIEIFPVPAYRESALPLNVRIDRPAIGVVYTVTGSQIGEPFELQAYQLYQFDITGLPAGIYILQFYINGKSVARRFLVI